MPSRLRWRSSCLASHRLTGILLALSILPSMISWLPAQANMAFEDVSKNAVSGIAYVVSYAITIFATLYYHWDLPGLAGAMLIGRAVEAAIRVGPLQRRMKELPNQPLPDELRARIRRFCLQALRNPTADIGGLEPVRTAF